MKWLQYLLLSVAVVVTVVSCTSDSFKIDGNLLNLDGQTVKVVFMSDSGVVEEWTPVDQHGKFAVMGHASQPVLVSIMDRMGMPLAMVVAVNGDHIKVDGDVAKLTDLNVKGSKLNEDWQLFRKEHRAFYNDLNPSRLDAAIEKFVHEHPGDMLSTVLLLADYSDYSDRDKLNTLLDGINESARPKSLALPLESWAGETRLTGHLPRLMTLNLMDPDGGFKEIKLTRQTTLIHLWANPQSGRQAVINELLEVDTGVCVIDVLAESDTLRWHRTIADDPTAWEHYWAPGGPLEQGLQLLGFTSVPWYAVTDSTGLVIYSGPDIKQALAKANSVSVITKN